MPAASELAGAADDTGLGAAQRPNLQVAAIVMSRPVGKNDCSHWLSAQRGSGRRSTLWDRHYGLDRDSTTCDAPPFELRLKAARLSTGLHLCSSSTRFPRRFRGG